MKNIKYIQGNKYKVNTRYITNHNTFNFCGGSSMKNMMVSGVACVIAYYLLMVSTIRSNLQLFAYL